MRLRRREFVLSAFGGVLYLACGGDEFGADPGTSSGNPSGDGGASDGGVEGPLGPTSSQDVSDRFFPQGIVSGDPRADRVVLWTRIDPAAAGKAETDDIELEVVIAKDEALTDVIARTKVTAAAGNDHTVRVVPTELESGRFYWYRFELSGTGNTTQVGRTKTAPKEDADVPVKFAFCACQDFIGRYWHAWRALLDEKADLDFVLFLGDYIYESVNDARFQSTTPDRAVTLPDGIDTSPAQDKSRIAAGTLADYRTLYKTYRSDPVLREIHRLYPFIIVWDDHEYADDCWQDHSTSFNGKDPTTGGPSATDEKNTPRRTAANHAFFDYQPVDTIYKANLTFPFDIVVYRQIRYGKHVDMFLTDQRQYRADHLIPEGVGADFSVGKFIDYTMVGSRYLVRKEGFDPKESDAKPTLLGAAQKAWFLDAVKKSNATWKVWGNEVQMYQMLLDLRLLPGVPDKIWTNPDIAPYVAYVNCDQWDGYRSERAEILKALSDANVQNLLVCTGDIHSFWAAELHVDFDNPGATPVGVEYVTAGISSASLKELFAKFVPSDSSAIHDALKFIIDAWTAAADGVIKDSSNVAGEYLKYADSNSYGFALMSIDGTKAEVQFVETGLPTDKTYGGVVSRTKFVTMAGSNKVTKLA